MAADPERLCNVHVDAFCTGKAAFTGNPAAVVIWPQSSAVSLDISLENAFPALGWMLKLAMENALSETAYIMPRLDGTYFIRWCTPGTEVDLCGHATLAAAHALWDGGYTNVDTVILHSRSGVLQATRMPDGRIQLDFPAEPVSHTREAESREVLELLPSCFGLEPARLQARGELALVLGERPRALSLERDDGQEAGVYFIGRNRHDLYVELDPVTFAALPRAPDMRIIASLKSRGLVVTARGSQIMGGDGEEESAAGVGPHFVSRWFGPQVGVPEDPVTGSAHCGLTPYWTARFLADAGSVGTTEYPWLKARQESERGGELRVRLVQDESTGDRVLMQGFSVTVVQAWLAPAAMPPSRVMPMVLAQAEPPKYSSFKELLAAPKGHLEYTPNEAFLLHVFWLAPSAAAAEELLDGLRKCATASHRDTPCVPTYLFRISNDDAELCPPPPRAVGDHPKLQDARRKMRMGVPSLAVRSQLMKIGLDPELADLEDGAPLPANMQQQPVYVEFTEVYLDERAFMEHAGSREYLDGYAVVMNPALHYMVPKTYRMGTPNPNMVEKILEPVLHEVVTSTSGAIWSRAPTAVHYAVFLSLDFSLEFGSGGSDVVRSLPLTFLELCTTCVAFLHPLREGTTRLMCALSSIPPQLDLRAVAQLQPLRGEAHVTLGDPEQVRAAFVAAGLAVTVNTSNSAGYALHASAEKIRPTSC